MSGRCRLPVERSLLPEVLGQRRTMGSGEVLEQDRGKQALPAESEGEKAGNQVPLGKLVLAGNWLTVAELVLEGLVLVPLGDLDPLAKGLVLTSCPLQTSRMACSKWRTRTRACGFLFVT